MERIRTVGIIGLGALGTLYAQLLGDGFGKENVLVLADKARIRRYRQDGIYYNGALCDFTYMAPEECTEPLDLLIFAVKFGGLHDAMESCRHLVNENTTLVSVLNGIASEQILSETFSPAQVVWCVAQKMSAKKEGNHVNVYPIGELALGVPHGMDDTHLRRLAAFFDEIRFPHSLPEDIRLKMWSKLLCNVGTNQPTMVFECGFGGLQVEGKPRETMFGAMREVIQVANAEGIPLSEEDIRYWVEIVDSFPADAEPSMRQDGKAKRKSEVDIFAGTICRLGEKHGIPTPVNTWLREQVARMEAAY